MIYFWTAALILACVAAFTLSPWAMIFVGCGALYLADKVAKPR
jgi:hypothetical protein